ncbi:hypothetical protein [Arthrobacter sp. Soil763]|uniref:hypothetical protein n=1 Tax=Arthrobacter sp. Soil763 TaxID=1736402 RepID=UPI0012F8C2AE|nr:hypothetical protein [Arthrobacter sp. Soil763]
MRLTYWALVVLGATGISVLWMRGYWVYYIGPVLTIAITSLVIDLVIRSAGVRNATGADGSKKRRIKRLIREVAWTMGVVTAVHIVVVFAVETAEVHTVTDRPESPETFTSEQYLTGKYIVRQDDNPVCRVGQYYSDCINDYVNQYNYSCADIELTLFSSVECKSYLQNIDDMKAKDQPGWIVSGVGGPGHLSRRAEVSSRDVSNNDYEPAVTHSAVCYLGFVGECLP